MAAGAETDRYLSLTLRVKEGDPDHPSPFLPIETVIAQAKAGQPLHDLNNLMRTVVEEAGPPLAPDSPSRAKILTDTYGGDEEKMKEDFRLLMQQRLWFLLGYEHEDIFLNLLPVTFPPPFWGYPPDQFVHGQPMADPYNSLPELNIADFSGRRRHTYLRQLGRLVFPLTQAGHVFIIGGRAKSRTGMELPDRKRPPYVGYPPNQDVDLMWASADASVSLAEIVMGARGSWRGGHLSIAGKTSRARPDFNYIAGAFNVRGRHPEDVTESHRKLFDLAAMERAGHFGPQNRLVHFAMSEATVNQVVIYLESHPDPRRKGGFSIGGKLVDLTNGLLDYHLGVILDGRRRPIIRYPLPEWAFSPTPTGFIRIALAVKTACELGGVFYDGQAGKEGSFADLQTDIYAGHRALRRRINILRARWPEILARHHSPEQTEEMFANFAALIKKAIDFDPRRALTLLSDYNVTDEETGSMGLGLAQIWFPRLHQVLKANPNWPADLTNPDANGLEYLDWLARRQGLKGSNRGNGGNHLLAIKPTPWQQAKKGAIPDLPAPGCACLRSQAGRQAGIA
jgi:hypothetical protein